MAVERFIVGHSVIVDRPVHCAELLERDDIGAEVVAGTSILVMVHNWIPAGVDVSGLLIFRTEPSSPASQPRRHLR